MNRTADNQKCVRRGKERYFVGALGSRLDPDAWVLKSQKPRGPGNATFTWRYRSQCRGTVPNLDLGWAERYSVCREVMAQGKGYRSFLDQMRRFLESGQAYCKN